MSTLRSSLHMIEHRLEAKPRDPAAIDRCVSDLESLAKEVTLQIEAAYLTVVDSAEPNAA